MGKPLYPFKMAIRNCTKGDNSGMKRKGILIVSEIGARYRSESQSSHGDSFFLLLLLKKKTGQQK